MKQKGFTLVELMIVVAIIGVLSAIAIPSYQEYVTKSKIQAGLQPVAEMKLRMNQWFDTNGSYKLSSDAANPCGIGKEGTTELAKYDTSNFGYVCTAPNDGAYTITITSKESLGVGAYIYTLDNNGREKTKTYAGTAYAVGTEPKCWKGFSC